MAQLTQSDRLGTKLSGNIRGLLAQFEIDGQHVLEAAAAQAGTFVTRGSAVDKCKPPTSAAEVQETGLGFLLRDASKGANGTSNEYAIGDTTSIVRRGPGIFVQCAETVAFGDKVFVIHAATNRGKIRNDIDSSNAAQLYHARVEEDGTTSTPALISLVSVTATPGPTGATGPTGA